MNKILILILSVLLLCFVAAGCVFGNKNSESANSGSNSNQSTDSSDSGNSGEKERLKTDIAENQLLNKYFIGDTIENGAVSLDYYGSLFSVESGTVTAPSGKQYTGEQITMDEAGVYTAVYELELYKEIIFGEFTFSVKQFSAEDALLKTVKSATLLAYYQSEYTAAETETVDFFGTEMTAQFDRAIYPDGSEVSENSFELSAEGEYSLKYTFENSGREYIAYRILKTKIKYINTTGEYMSAVGENSTVEINKGVINTTLYKGEYLKVNEIIDVSAASFVGSYTILQSIFSDETICFKTLRIVVTDVDDADNYFTVLIKNLGDLGKVYVQAFACGQDELLSGGYGVCTMFGTVESNALNILYDNSLRQIAAGAANNVIADFDDPSVYGENVWSGFLGGECLISIYAEDWTEGVDSAMLDFGYIGDSKKYELSYQAPLEGTEMSGKQLSIKGGESYSIGYEITLPTTDGNWWLTELHFEKYSEPTTLTVKVKDCSNAENYYTIKIVISSGAVTMTGCIAGGEETAAAHFVLHYDSATYFAYMLNLAYQGKSEIISSYLYSGGGQSKGIDLQGFKAENVTLEIASDKDIVLTVRYMGDNLNWTEE